MRLPAIAIVALLAVPVPIQVSSAGCGTAPTLETAAAKAPVVFIGTARSVSPTSNEMVFDVAWQWKGRQTNSRVSATVSAGDDLATSAASRLFQNGQSYVVFTANAFAPFVIDACSGSVPYVADGSVIPPNLWEPLGNSEPQLPAAAPAADRSASPPTFTAMAAAAILGVLGLIVLRGLWIWNRGRRARRSLAPLQQRRGRLSRELLLAQQRGEEHRPSSGEKSLRRQRIASQRRRKKRNSKAA